MSKTELTPEQTLFKVLAFDIGKRYEILREECHHLVQSTEFRMELPPENNGSSHSHGNDSLQAFCARLTTAAELLKEECDADVKELDEFKGQREDWLKTEDQEVTRKQGGAPSGRSDQDWAQLRHIELAWHAKMMFKASLIAERIGDLHDRLAQLLQRTNPDHPDPTLRRRTEQGLIDKYLTEQARWVHRDIARFAMKAGTRYPYDQVPATFQSWDYDYTSRHHSFLPSLSYEKWTEWNRSGREGSQKPRKFASLRLSYWMTERMPLHPIIGHEIAHQVLRDSFGHVLSHPQLEHDHGQIARLFRRLAGCSESWLSCRPNVNCSAEAESLSIEIVCDLLAAVRYGHGYAYAWILEMVGDDSLASLFSDETSMLQRFWGSGEARAVGLETMRGEFLWGTQRLQQALPKTYYRGVVLLRFLRESTRTSDDPTADELSSALELFLQYILELYVGRDGGRLPYEKAFATDLANTVCSEFCTSTGSTWRTKSKFLRLADRFWRQPWIYHRFNSGKPLANTPLNHQLLTQSFRELLKSLPNKIGCCNSAFDWPNVKMMSDATWRIEWLMEKHNTKRHSPSAINEVRAVLFVGVDDYIYRTTNPATFLRAIGEEIPNVPSNTVKDDKFSEVYDLTAVERIDDFLRAPKEDQDRRSTNSSYAGQLIKIPPASIDYLDTLFVRKDDLQKWFGISGNMVPGHFHLELVRTQNYLLSDVTFLTSPDSQESPSPHSDDDCEEATSSGSENRMKYEALVRTDLLGRYDSLILAKQGPDGGKLEWWDREKGKRRYVSRVKKLIQFDKGKLCSDDDHFIAVVLVSLKWEAFRSLVGRWLVSEKFRSLVERLLVNEKSPQFKSEKLKLNMFLSDGWEDFVLLAHVPKSADPKEDDPEYYKEAVHEFLKVVQVLNEHPLIKATESMFGSGLLGEYTGNQLRFRFVCRFGEEKSKMAYREVVEKALKKGDIIEQRNLAGNKDTELVVNPEAPAESRKDIHKALHSDNLRDWRVETRVSWIRNCNSSNSQ